MERRIGLDPFNADSDGDGILDGDEDLDGDGLSNRWEIQEGFDPIVAKSSSPHYPQTGGNDTLDGEKDLDGDGMPTNWEILHGLDPFINDAHSDPDGDSYTNIEEYPDFNPKDPNSHPTLEPPGTFKIYDNDNFVENITNSINYRVQISDCGFANKIYIGDTNTPPTADKQNADGDTTKNPNTPPSTPQPTTQDISTRSLQTDTGLSPCRTTRTN